jgi:hypothetical protein
MFEIDKLEAAIKQLEQALQEACLTYLERTDGGRQAAIMQLRAVREFVATCITGYAGSKTAPLDALMFALADLDRGARPAILEAAHVSNRPPISTDLAIVRNHAWRAVNRLKQIGFKPLEACKLVAGVLVQCGVSFEGSPVSPMKVVKQWCKDIRMDLSQTTIAGDPVSEAKNEVQLWIKEDARAINDQVLPAINCGERTIEDTRDYILYLLSVDVSWAGEANRPGDGMEARWQKAANRLHHEQLMARALRSPTGEKG